MGLLPPRPSSCRPCRGFRPRQPPVGFLAIRTSTRRPPRQTVGLDLVRNGWTYNCMECHKLFPAKWHYERNRWRPLATRRPSERAQGHPARPRQQPLLPQLPSPDQPQCVRGLRRRGDRRRRTWCSSAPNVTARSTATGRRACMAGTTAFGMRSWASKTKLRCIQCHDPHSPKFKAMKPLPPLRYPPRAAHPPRAERRPA